MAYVGLLLRLGIYCIPSHSRWRHGGALASSISVQRVFIFFWCQSCLLVDRRDACWWVLSGWFPGRRVSPCGAGHLRYPASPWLVVPLWVSAPVRPRSAVLVVSISCRQCWPYKDLRRLALFVGHPRNGGAEVRRRSHRWELGADVMGGRIKGWALLSWHWSVNSANDKRFSHSELGAHLFHLSFSAETSTKHLQLHLLCFGSSQFKNGIGRAFRLSGLVWSLDSLYSWSDKGCCGLWGQAFCACNLSNSDAMS